MQEPNPKVTASEAETKPKVDVVTEEGGFLMSSSSGDSSGEWQKIREQVINILSELPGYVSKFFGEYQKPIITIGLIVSTLVTIKVMLAVVDAINDIPLLSPTLELIGIGYSAWFVYRYLLRASNRQELVKEIRAIKEGVVGNK